MTDDVKALLAAAEERRRRYSRRATLLERLTFALHIPAFVATAVSLAAAFYGWWQAARLIGAMGLALWSAGYVSFILYSIYKHKATEAARQACTLRCIIEKKRKTL